VETWQSLGSLCASVLGGAQTPLAQSEPTAHLSWSAQGAHVPPQSTSVSVPFSARS
jgi:hypothetical protein